METPFDQLRDLFKESNQQNKELLKYVFEKSDSISLWIIGLAVGAISIFANNIAGLQSAISSCFLKPILILLAVSVSCGIIYRSLYLYFFVILNQTLRGIDIAFSKKKLMDTESLLKGNENFNEVLQILFDGFGIDFSHMIAEYNNSGEIKRKELYDSVVSHYNNYIDFAKKSTEDGLDFIADTYSTFTGTSKAKYLKATKGDSGSKQYQIVSFLTVLFYLIYICSFILSLFLFVYSVK